MDGWATDATTVFDAAEGVDVTNLYGGDPDEAQPEAEAPAPAPAPAPSQPATYTWADIPAAPVVSAVEGVEVDPDLNLRPGEMPN
jgi:hypothetical protein